MSDWNRAAFVQFEREMRIGKRLGVDLFAGDTNPHIRADRLRALILERGWADRIAFAKPRVLTWADVFAQTYGEPLEQRQLELA